METWGWIVLCLTPAIAFAAMWYGHEWGKEDGWRECDRIADRRIVDAQMKIGQRSAEETRDLLDEVFYLKSKIERLEALLRGAIECSTSEEADP